MKIIESLVKEIGGEFHIAGDSGHGACFTVTFSSSRPVIKEA